MKPPLSRVSSISVVVCLLLVSAIALSLTGVALAAWSDVSPGLVAPYGISAADLEGISQGYADGTWKPGEPMLRKHFIKMAVEAFGVSPITPAVRTFSDVLPSDPFYRYVEGAAAAGLTTGVGGGKFAPNAQITREQAVAMIARWLAQKRGVSLGTYYDTASAGAILDGFSDAGSVSVSLVREVAYAVDEAILQGSGSLLQPRKTLTRLQGAAMLLRARGASGTGTSSTTSTSGSSTTSESTGTTGSTTTTTTDSTTTSTSTTTTSTTTTTTTDSTTTSSSSTTSSTSSTTSSSTTSSSTTTTAVAGAKIFGRVLDEDGQAVVGAMVKVVLDAIDTRYQASGDNTVGTATTDSQGHYQVSTTTLPLGSVVDVTVTASGYTSVFVYGTYNETAEEVNFANFSSSGGDRRMRLGSQMPGLPFEGLLPE